MRTIIVDDEATARAAIRAELVQYCPQLELIGESDGMAAAIELINQLRPDLIFLDIQLGDGSGFQVLDKMLWKDCCIIFITGYDQYAIRAFKANAIDYLLKPFETSALLKAVEKASLQRHYMMQAAALKQLLLNRPDGLAQKIAIPLSGGISLFATDEIVKIEALGNYSKIYLRNKDTLLSAKTLKEFEDSLQHSGFERVHHSHLINLVHLKKYLNKDGLSLELSDGSLVPLSKRKKAHILSLLEHISI